MQTTYVEVFWYWFRKRLRKIWQKKGVRICVRCCLVRGLLLLLVERRELADYYVMITVPGIKRLCYRFGLLDRPGAYYDMQNEASYSDGEDEEDAVDGTRNGRRPQATNLYDPRHHDREESD